MTTLQNHWASKATQFLAGERVKDVSYDSEGAPVITFESGLELTAVSDEEGNGPGAIYTNDDRLTTIPSVPSSLR